MEFHCEGIGLVGFDDVAFEAAKTPLDIEDGRRSRRRDPCRMDQRRVGRQRDDLAMHLESLRREEQLSGEIELDRLRTVLPGAPMEELWLRAVHERIPFTRSS